METSSKANDSFKHFLNEDNCTSIFQIPSHLVKTYGDVLPPIATLRTDDSGKGWNVSIEKFKDQYFFTDGWKEFAEQVDLKSREFLMFKSACMLSGSGTKGEKSKTSDDKRDLSNSILHVNCEKKDFGVGESLSFSKELNESNLYRLSIPRSFVSGTGIAKGEEIKLKDSTGREWPVHLREAGGMLYLSRGWYDFLIGNNVVVGSTIAFFSLSKYRIETRVVKEGTNKQALFSSVKKRGNCFVLNFELNKTRVHAKVPRKSRLKVNREKEDDFPEEENHFGIGKRWGISKKLKEYNAYTLDIPKDFSMIIGEATNVEIKLMDPKGRKWPVQVKYRKSACTYRITTGWKDFCVGNKARVGSIVLLKSIPNRDDMIKARVIVNGNEGKWATH